MVSTLDWDLAWDSPQFQKVDGERCHMTILDYVRKTFYNETLLIFLFTFLAWYVWLGNEEATTGLSEHKR